MPQQRHVRHASLVLLAVLAAACRDASVNAPSSGAAVRVRLAAPLAPRGPDFTLDAVRVTATPYPGTGAEVANRVVRFAGAASVAAELALPLGGEQARFVVRVAATDAASPQDTVFRGEDTVTVERASPGTSEVPAQAEVALRYAGPDLAVASIELAPRDTSFTLGDSVRLRVVAKRADGTVVPNARVRLSVDDASASLTTAGFVKAASASSAPFGGAWVYAGTANGVVDSVRVAARRPGVGAWVMVAGGGAHTCALDDAGAAYCWGVNGEGQLGDGTFTDRLSPTPVAGGLTFGSITAGAEHTCALTTAGVAYCWGSTANGKLGTGTSGGTQPNTPAAVAGGLRFQWLDAGDQHTCGVALLTPGEPGPVYCWGNNSSGRLGDGTQTSRAVPTPVAAQVAFARVSAGGNQTCGMTPDGHAYCWGYNGDGQVGDGTYGNQQGGVADRLVPTAVATQLLFREVYTGGYHSCGLTTAGAAYCWGDNNVWQIGNGEPPTDVTTPTAVLGGHTFTTMMVGGGHSCGREANGSLWCWGINADAQLGDDTINWRSSPVQVVAGGVQFTALGFGDGHSCAVAGTASGGGGPLHCWGRNGAGQLGDGTRTRRLTPTPVSAPGTVRPPEE